MRRHATTLTKLTEAEDRLRTEAAALTKKRAALARQREHMTRQAQTAQYLAAGQLLERMGLPIADLSALELILKPLNTDTKPLHQNHALSNTANVPFAEKDTPQ